MTRRVAALAAAVTLCFCGAAVAAPPSPFGWEGEHRSQRVTLTSERTGAQLAGTAFAPPASESRRGRHPVVVIVPGSGGLSREEHYHWSARELAAHGYVVVGVDPQGIGRSAVFGSEPCGVPPDLEYPYPCAGVPFQQRTNFDDAALSGLAWAFSSDNPYRSLVGRSAGVAGHSLGAAAAMAAQERDPRVRAIVAWDGLSKKAMATDTNSPSHHVINGHVGFGDVGDRDVEVRAPALALHSDHETTSPWDSDPQKKNRGWFHWRAHGMPSMVMTMRGVTHGGFGQDETGTADGESLQRIQWYTRAWFDLWLRRDPRAYKRLLAREVVGMPRAEALSAQFPSTAFLPARKIDCEDLRQPCAGM